MKLSCNCSYKLILVIYIYISENERRIEDHENHKEPEDVQKKDGVDHSKQFGVQFHNFLLTSNPIVFAVQSVTHLELCSMILQYSGHEPEKKEENDSKQFGTRVCFRDFNPNSKRKKNIQLVRKIELRFVIFDAGGGTERPNQQPEKKDETEVKQFGA